MAFTAPKIYLTQAGHWARFWGLLSTAVVGVYEDGCLGIAKGVAYSSLLSFFPVLTTIATLLVQAKANDVARIIARFLYQAVPPGTEDVVLTLFVVHGERPRYLLIGAITLAAWAASGAMMSMMEGFRAIYRIPSGRSFVQERGMAILLVFISLLPMLGASGLIIFGRRAERALLHWTGVASDGAEFRGWVLLAGQAIRLGTAFAAIVTVTAFIYYFGPNRKQAFRHVFPGAVLATILWLVATLALGWYIPHVANYNVLYGSVGAGLALLVWMYVLAVITLLGCEFNVAREKLLAAPDVNA